MRIKRSPEKRRFSHLALLAGACFFNIFPSAHLSGQQSALHSQTHSKVTMRTDVPELSFDVASIRETRPAAGYSQRLANPPHHSEFDASSLWVTQIIGEAYDVDYSNQVIGGPNWIHSERFDIKAKSDSVVDDQLTKMSDEQARLVKQHMLQQLLADRFRLRVHEESKERPTFALRTGKRAPKLHESLLANGVIGKNVPFDDSHGIRSQGSSLGVELIGHGASMTQLAGLLGFYLRTPVVDQTGLKGIYDFDLQFHGQRSDFQDESSDVWPPAETAVQEQLGLTLVLTKNPVEMIVIDAIEKPSPN